MAAANAIWGDLLTSMAPTPAVLASSPQAQRSNAEAAAAAAQAAATAASAEQQADQLGCAPQPSQVMTAFLNNLPGDLVQRFWSRFVHLGVLDLHSLSKLSQAQLRQVVPPLGPYRHLYAELQKDWHCEKCGFVNYARYGNAECYRCSHHRTGGKSSGAALHTANDADSARISAMLAEREQTRRSQDFERADAIREQLRMMGVVWDDDMKTWRTPDGRCGRWGTPSHAAAAAGAGQGGYCIKLRGLPFRVRYDNIRNFFALTGIEILQYSVVLEKNADGRPSGVGYVKVATQAEQQLACSQLNHKHIPGYDRYAWVVESTEAEYLAAANSWAGVVLNDTPSDGDSQVTSQKLKEREECRKARNYQLADSIRDALRDEGVTFDDELRTWSDKQGSSGRWGLKTPSFSSTFGFPPTLSALQVASSAPMTPLTPVGTAYMTPRGTPMTAELDMLTPLCGLESDCSTASWPSSGAATPVDRPLEPAQFASRHPPAARLDAFASKDSWQYAQREAPGATFDHRDLASILDVCSDPADETSFNKPSRPEPLVSRLQSILSAVSENPRSP